MPTREQLANLQRVVDLGQRMCDVLETIRSIGGVVFDRDGNGPGFVATPEDNRECPGASWGGYLVDIEGWHRAMDLLGADRPELKIPHRPRPRPRPTKDEDEATCTCETRETPDAPHKPGCPAEEAR